eukprot:4137800-Lingulodinium_polyedra.AAC.1
MPPRQAMTPASTDIGRMTSQWLGSGRCGAAGFSPEEGAPRRFAPGSTAAVLPAEGPALSSRFVFCFSIVFCRPRGGGDVAPLERARPLHD